MTDEALTVAREASKDDGDRMTGLLELSLLRTEASGRAGAGPGVASLSLVRTGTRRKQRVTKTTTDSINRPSLGRSDPDTDILEAWISGRHFHLVWCGKDMS